MSKEVKRWKRKQLDLMHPEHEVVDANDHDAAVAALLAERDVRLLQVDTLTEWYSNSLDVINEITAALPGAHYMDPPDGGDVSVPEQVRRMAKDAERYRWICSASYGAPSHPFIVINDFDSDKASIDAAIDAALQGEQP